MKPKPTDSKTEITCLTCDGTGLLSDTGAKHTFQVRLCNGCNGHGVVIVTTHTSVKFGTETRVQKYAVSDGVPCE